MLYQLFASLNAPLLTQMSKLTTTISRNLCVSTIELFYQEQHEKCTTVHEKCTKFMTIKTSDLRPHPTLLEVRAAGETGLEVKLMFFQKFNIVHPVRLYIKCNFF